MTNPDLALQTLISAGILHREEMDVCLQQGDSRLSIVVARYVTDWNSESESVRLPGDRRVTKVTRLENTANGNGRYRVWFDDQTRATTRPDSSFIRTVDWDSLAGRWVVATFDSRGQIEALRVLDG